MRRLTELEFDAIFMACMLIGFELFIVLFLGQYTDLSLKEAFDPDPNSTFEERGLNWFIVPMISMAICIIRGAYYRIKRNWSEEDYIKSIGIWICTIAPLSGFLYPAVVGPVLGCLMFAIIVGVIVGIGCAFYIVLEKLFVKREK